MKFARVFVVAVFVLGLAGITQARPTTNVDGLKQIQKKEQERIARQRGPAFQALKKNIPLKGETPGGRMYELIGLEPSGRPLYLITDNVNAAKTISTFPLQPGGLSGLELDGAGTDSNQLAIWDGGSVLANHTELNGRVFVRDNGSPAEHATHVAGTMIAQGKEFSARGMSPAAQLSSYEWTSDTDEMAGAAANGLRLSNHSYGYIRGWAYGNWADPTNADFAAWHWFGDVSVSQVEDAGFGFYSSESQAFDQIAYDAPYYLICKSAGNDRGEKPALGTTEHYYQIYSPANGYTWVRGDGDGGRDKDGGYYGFDCLGDVASAKNILTVGAVKDITTGYTGPIDLRTSTLESYSAFGPTDDGRVKPDILGNGQQLYSTLSDNTFSYGTMSGTSMATPNVTGSVNLLLRYYESTHQDSMLASTVKALVIHTADDDGIYPGPDYHFGWGLMNTSSAVAAIQKDTTDTMTISEHLLLDGEGDAWTFNCSGDTSLKITICWTDPAGTPGNLALNDRTPKLVNDLDLWVVGPDGIHFPWTLDPDNPSYNARRDRSNHVDNVEQVYVDTAAAGEYTVYVTTSGTLTNGQQEYSMIVTGVSDTLQVTSVPTHKSPALPTDFNIVGSFPNPFNPTATVQISLPESARLTVKVYNVLGREVATLAQGVQTAGIHSYIFNGQNLPSGIYFVRAKADGMGVRTHKMLLVR